MFRRKYNITLLDSKWNPIKYNMKFYCVPRKSEFIYLDKYYEIINVVHDVSNKHNILVVVSEFNQQNSADNQPIKK